MGEGGDGDGGEPSQILVVVVGGGLLFSDAFPSSRKNKL